MSDLEKELNKAMDTSNKKIKWVEDPKGYFTIKPFFSRDSNMSYVRERGTSDIDDSSPAVDVPLERSAVQTFTSYRLRSNIFLNLLKNSSLTIMIVLVWNSI